LLNSHLPSPGLFSQQDDTFLGTEVFFLG